MANGLVFVLNSRTTNTPMMMQLEMRLLCRGRQRGQCSLAFLIGSIERNSRLAPLPRLTPRGAAVSADSPCLAVGLALPTGCHSEVIAKRLRAGWRSETTPDISSSRGRKLRVILRLILFISGCNPLFSWISSHFQAPSCQGPSHTHRLHSPGLFVYFPLNRG